MDDYKLKLDTFKNVRVQLKLELECTEGAINMLEKKINEGTEEVKDKAK